MDSDDGRTLIQSLLGVLQGMTPGARAASVAQVEEQKSDSETDQDDQDQRDQLSSEDRVLHLEPATDVNRINSESRNVPAESNVTRGNPTDPRFVFPAPNSFQRLSYQPSPAEIEMRERLSRPHQRLLYENRDHEDENRSVRKSLGDPQNVTARDSKRPKERKGDKEY
jgi:hypothetical protein